jgi:hypothetical protein
MSGRAGYFEQAVSAEDYTGGSLLFLPQAALWIPNMILGG